MEITLARVIAVANQKGGTGKTPTVANLGYALFRMGYHVLLVDFDPQGSLSAYFLGADEADNLPITIYNAITTLKRIEPIEIAPKFSLLPAHDELEAATLELPSRANAERRLAKVLRYYQFDFCLIDTQPSLGLLTRNALAAANQVIIPVKTELSAERTLRRILALVDEVKESDLNEKLTIWGILPTLFDVRKAHHKEVLQAIQHKHQHLVYPFPSLERTAYNDALTAKVDVRELDKSLGEYWDAIARSVIKGG